MSTTTFYRLAQNLTVGDIYSPIICPVDANELVDDLWTDWSQESLVLPQDRWDDGHRGSIVLVYDKESLYGWYDLRTHDFGDRGPDIQEDCGRQSRDIPISETAIRISANEIIVVDTPILDAIRQLSDASVNGLLVVSPEKIIGVLRPIDLYKMEGRLCLFSLTLSIEAGMLRVMQRRSKDFMKLIDSYKLRKNLESRFKGKFPERHMLDRDYFMMTFFSDKIHMFTDPKPTRNYDLPKPIRNQAYELREQVHEIIADPNDVLVKLRNNIAHHTDDEDIAEILPVSSLFIFIKWMLLFHDDLISQISLDYRDDEDEDELLAQQIQAEEDWSNQTDTSRW